MTAFLIGAAERAALAAGQPAVVAPPGMLGLESLPMAVLRPVQGVLRQDGASDGPAEPLPAGLRPLAILAADAAGAAELAAGLPPGLPQVTGSNPLPGLLALAMQALAAAEATRLRLQAAAAGQPAARQQVIDLPPAPMAPPPPARVTQHLGRPAEGLCGLALHLAAVQASAASLLRVRLLAAGRVLGAWTVPGSALAPGWLALDLPEPAPPGAAEAVLEVAAEVAPNETLQLSAAGAGPLAPLALRAETAAPHHLALPRHFDWAARDLPAPAAGLALPVPEAAWAAAVVEGAESRMVAAGGEAPRMLLELEPGGTAQLRLPSLPPGATDLALAELACRLGDATGLQVALTAGPESGPARDSGWRIPDATGALRIALPLPAGLGGALLLGLALRNRGTAALTVEVSALALMAGAAGAPRRLLPEPGLRTPGLAPQPARLSVPLPGAAPAPLAEVPPAASGLPGPPPRAATTQPPLAGGEAGGPLPPPAPATTPMTLAAPMPVLAAEMPPGGSDFQDIKLHQHTANADGSYRHLDLGLTGLVSAAGVWREVRLKLFDRRGTVGLEFRRIKGWPNMFETWPKGGSDQFGPYYRLETEATAEAMAKLTSPQDRAMMAALLEVLPALVRRAARLAGLPPEEQEGWGERGRVLASAVEASRPVAPRGVTVGPG
ncbi:DUF6212 domain-containing protein [Falsiroseomonas tokyonensis]|uniref:DUF6212 domain-containing protein n=1 Tax=Falsiroseomonas tokyonensis TaxID=430521 RepID=A0ABV7BR66_9PROT|nr:DUF6212 domain-containing protein [Falsiroseomonas tokyonensis]MBU8538109.1 hypothetical protein [Falsiroseomonas tokyonensis]